MIGLFLLLAAQAATPAPNAAPPPPTQRICRHAPGSETVVCDVTAQPQNGYRLPKYGPAAPRANRGKSVRVGAQTTNRGPARRNRSMATVGIPF